MGMFFQVESVTEQIYRIKMPYVCCYLIVGEKKAVLLDTGWGYGDLKAVVESLTDLPVTVILSHGHVDHNGASSQFEEVFLNEKDFAMNALHNQIAYRKAVMLTHVPADFQEDTTQWQPARTAPYTQLTSEMSFDLGGLTILPFDLPGHSPGSMVFILPEIRIAIFDDALSHPTVMFLEDSTKIQVHYNAMLAFSPYSDLYDRVLVNHETYELDKMVLENNLKLAKAILEGTDAQIPTSKNHRMLSGNETIYYAARKKQHWLPEDPREMGNIYYTKDKL